MTEILAAPLDGAGQEIPAGTEPSNRVDNAQTFETVSVQNRPRQKIIHGEFWTPERVEILRAQWATNTAIPKIAAAIGGTKGQVIGKARRLELPMHEGSMYHPDRKNSEKKRPRYGTPRAIKFKVVKRVEAPTAPDVLNIAFMDLEHHHCRYPTTSDHPFLFCGAVKSGDSSYCAHHHALCHTEPRGREDRTRKPYLNPYRRAA